MCGNDFLVPIPSHFQFHLIIPIPTHSNFHFRQRYYIDNPKADVYIQNKIWSYSISIVNLTHHSSVIIIVTITTYSLPVHCSTFIRLSLHVTVQKQQAVHTAGGNFIKYAIPIPIRTILIPIPISSRPKTTPIPM